MTNFKDGKWHISKTADLGIKTGSNECRVLVFGNNNTGTNLVEKLITSQGCTPHAQGHAARRTPFWKHKLLTSEDLDRAKKANVDAVIVTTRHPYCWARGMKKAPYPKDQIKRNFVGLELGEVWKSGTGTCTPFPSFVIAPQRTQQSMQRFCRTKR